MTTDPTTKTESPATPAIQAAPAPPQSVRIETTLWWGDGDSVSVLTLGSSPGKWMASVAASPNGWDWTIAYEVRHKWHFAPTREAAKAAALQAVMEAIGAKEVKDGPSAEQIQQRIAEGQAIVDSAERSLEKLFRESNTTIIGSGKPEIRVVSVEGEES